MRIKFNEPAILNDLQNRREVKGMEITTIAFNLAPPPGHGELIMSVTLRDRDTGHQVHYIYEDLATDKGETKAFWNHLKAVELPTGESWLSQILARLVRDGRLPEGAITS